MLALVGPRVGTARPEAARTLHDLGSGVARIFEGPEADGMYTVPRFTPDETAIVWVSSYRRWLAQGPHRFQVQHLDDGRTTPLPVRLGSCRGPSYATVHNGGIYFTTGGASIYHIRLDGTGLERVFPTKQALTLAEFEAEASP